jgi:hypothetical protein
MPDHLCVDCHRDLKAHTLEMSGTDYQNVTRFDRDHPQFHFKDRAGNRVSVRSDPPPEDPGRLKFNHKLHLSKGLDPNGKLYRYGDIADPAARDRYWRLSLTREERDAEKRGDENAPVQLNCAACHQLDSEDFEASAAQLAGLPSAAVLPPRAAGATMLPITYENQCKACHPLTYDKKVAMPHRLQSAKVREYLESYFTLQLLQDKPTLFKKKVPLRDIPGRGPDKEMTEAFELIRDQVIAAEKILYQDKTTCKECHEYYPPNQVFPERIVPPNVPTVWLPHAKFSHTAHRVIECLSCHEGAKDSKTSADVLLPGIETCLPCHAPPSRTRGGARFDCTECHRYHHGDTPLRGLGTEQRDPGMKRTIREVLGD